MYTQFAPMSSSTVQFAKDYRAEQISAADQSRVAAMFTQPRRSVRSRFHDLYTTATGHLHHRTSKTGHAARPAH